MLGTSICPHCDATFNIGEPQLEAKLGLVRCGRCLEIFDFRISYVANQPNTQLELPISDEHALELDFTASLYPTPPDEHTSATDTSKLATPVDFDISIPPELPGDENQPVAFANEFDLILTDDTHDIETLMPTELDNIETLLPVEDDQQLPEKTVGTKTTGIEELQEIDYEFSGKLKRVWPWTVATALSMLVFLVQIVYLLRVDLAANFPLTKPTLTSACEILKCTVPLPQNVTMMSIESSSLEDAPQNHVVLNALLRNRATFAQAFPSLELTLTDTHDGPQARRIFKPSDYLPPTESETTGLLPNHEIPIKLHLDTMDIKPSGYRLVLFYPQTGGLSVSTLRL